MTDITGQLENAQQIEVFVSGPEDANRLYLCTGMAQAYLGAYNDPNGANQTFTFRIGPVLTRTQMVRATASVAFASTNQYELGSPSSYSYGVQNVEADWDDESGQVEVRFDLFATSQNLYVTVSKVSYQVSILAALPAA